MTENLTSFEDYQNKAFRTMKPDPFLQQVLHCVMGMAGEIGEFVELEHTDSHKRVGEIGDCMWYASGLATVLDLSLDYMLNEAKEINALGAGPYRYRSGEERATIWACRLTDLVKKSVFYSKELDVQAAQMFLTHYWAALLAMCSKMSVDPLAVALANIRKLEARYPDQMFNADHAKNRSYANESAAAGVEVA